MKKISLFAGLFCCFAITQAFAEVCKVDRIKVNNITTIQPAVSMSEGTIECLTFLATYGAGKVITPVSLFAGSFSYKGIFISEKYINEKIADQLFDQLLSDEIGALFSTIDSEFPSPDDLIVRINGHQVAPALQTCSNLQNIVSRCRWIEMAKDAVLPRYDHPEEISASFFNMVSVTIAMRFLQTELSRKILTLMA